MDTTQAEETVRKILQRSLERPQIIPGDDDERRELINAYWATIAGARKHLLKVIGHRAAAAFGGYDYQNSEDVLDDAFLNAWDRLDEQFTLGEGALAPIPSSSGATSEKHRFIFAPAGKLSLVGWIATLIGTGKGQKAGVLGAHLKRDHLQATRFVDLLEGDDDEFFAQVPDLAATNPEHIIEYRRTLGKYRELFYAALESRKPHERFAIECQWLFFELQHGRDPADFWGAVETLVDTHLRSDERPTSMALVTGMREKAAADDKLLKGIFLKLLGKIVSRSDKQVSRWYNECDVEVRRAIDGKSGDLGAQPA